VEWRPLGAPRPSCRGARRVRGRVRRGAPRHHTDAA
jgi:hypothetical protein